MLRKEDGHALRRVLEFEVEGHVENESSMRAKKKRLASEHGRCVLPIKVDCWC